jgi:phage gpG-like protein
MPARKIIALTESDKDKIIKAVQARLVRLTKEGR